MARITKSTQLDDHTLFTLVDKRGLEVVVNVHELAKRWVDFQSDLSNEHQQGWDLSPGWYEEELGRIAAGIQPKRS